MQNVTLNILNLENNLLQQRKMLNDLIFYSKNENDEIILNKIDILEKDIVATQYQLNILKQSIANKEKIHCKQQTYKQQQVVCQQQIISNQQKSPQLQSNKKSVDFKKKDLENIFGKSFMGIFASVLIFISLIIFASIIVPFLTNTIKLILMYLFSFGLTCVGFFLLKKDDDNKLYLSLSGCGVGSIYISLFLSNIYFGMLNDVLLYICLFIWSVCIYKIKHKNNIFLIIGQIGIVLASYFGITKCFINDDFGKLLFLCFFFVITQLTYNYAIKNKNIFLEQLPIITFATIILYMIKNFENTNTLVFYSITIVAFMLFINILFLIKNLKTNIKNEINEIMFILINGCLTFSLLFDNINILLLIMSIISHIYIEYKTTKIGLKTKIPIISTLYSIIYLSLTNILPFDFFGLSISAFKLLGFSISSFDLLWLIVLGFVVYGCYKNDMFYKIYASILMTIYVYRNTILVEFIETIPIWIIISIIIVSSIIFDKIFKSKDNILKISMYLGSVLILPIFIKYTTYDLFNNNRYIIQSIIDINIIFFLNVFIRKTLLYKNNNICKLTNYSTNITNGILMLISLFIINFKDITPILLIELTIISICMFTINSKNLLEKQNVFYGIYVGFKFLLLMIVVLNAIDTVNFVLSICCFAFACISIYIGFIKNHKSLRIFGLILSFISTIKLILFDFNYESSIEKAFSFFICGVICFIISLIYNKVNKNLNIN